MAKNNFYTKMVISNYVYAEETKGQLTIALLQNPPARSLGGNLERGLAACRKARELGADIALFPDMWSNGYNLYDRPIADWMAEAIPADGPFVKSFSGLAKELDMAIGITLLEAWEGGPKNTLLLMDRHGETVLRYSKVHTCDFDVERNLTPGDGFCVADLDTAAGQVKVGAMICYDREFPESARVLMLSGAEVVLVPNACPMEINRLSQLRARAFENMLCIATCNYPGGVPDCNGHSTVFDGIAFKEKEDAYDMRLLEAGEAAGIYLAKVDLDELRKYRRAEAFGNAYRHPRKYGKLVDEEIHPPFIRKDYRP